MSPEAGAHAVSVLLLDLSSSGSDSYTPKSDEAKLFCIFYCTLGIPFTLFLLTLLSNFLLPVVTHAPVHHLHAHWGLPYPRAALIHASFLLVLVLCFLFLIPALLICVVEPDWSFLDALFYCFLVLSTVGEGGKGLGTSWSPAAKETLELLTTCKSRNITNMMFRTIRLLCPDLLNNVLNCDISTVYFIDHYITVYSRKL